MSQMALHTLVGTALIDRKFCADLLNGRRPILLTKFDLTDEEREFVLFIEAESIREFAVQLCEWLETQRSTITHPSMAALVSHSPLQSQAGSIFCQENRTPRQYARSLA
jgi:hypothetical protein